MNEEDDFKETVRVIRVIRIINVIIGAVDPEGASVVDRRRCLKLYKMIGVEEMISHLVESIISRQSK